MWQISKASYYADWVTIPFLVLCIIVSDVSYHSASMLAAGAFLLGVGAMSFIEYGMHRWMFHNPRLYRREHWAHHLRPSDYVGIPGWQTGIYFLIALAVMVTALGLDFGGGLFIGVALYYLAYIVTHDRFHHGDLGLLGNGYWARRRRAHLRHHQRGEEVNFGVASHWWDVLLGTYRRPF